MTLFKKRRPVLVKNCDLDSIPIATYGKKQAEQNARSDRGAGL